MTVTVCESDYRFANVKVKVPGLAAYSNEAEHWYQPTLSEVKKIALEHRASLSNGVVWIINSVAHGGGVAEMLPHHISLLRDLGIDARWMVYQPNVDGFFSITKRLHNSLHDKDCDLTKNDFDEYDRVSELCSKDLEDIIMPEDRIIVHDLQPLGAVAHYLKNNPRPSAWRCHIGYPKITPIVEKTWNYLESYTSYFDTNIFTAAEYGRPKHKGQVFIPPTLNPASVKNGQRAPIDKLFTKNDLSEILTAKSAVKLSPSDLVKMTESPYFLQVARWDLLKGFDKAIEAFDHFCKLMPDSKHSLFLVGPDPRGIVDDPEDEACLNFILTVASRLKEDIRSRVRILLLSMEDNDVNAAIVGHLQENSYSVLQLSQQEGYGLSLTEALFKAKPAIIRDAFGLRMQIEDGRNGYIVGSDENIAEQTAKHMVKLAADVKHAESMGERAKALCRGNSTQLSQLPQWLNIIIDLKSK